MSGINIDSYSAYHILYIIIFSIIIQNAIHIYFLIFICNFPYF